MHSEVGKQKVFEAREFSSLLAGALLCGKVI